MMGITIFLKFCMVKYLSFQTFCENDLKLKQFTHTRLFHNIDKTLFIIFYNHFSIENFKIEKPSVKVEISNLINYSIVCCQNGKSTMVK